MGVDKAAALNMAPEGKALYAHCSRAQPRLAFGDGFLNREVRKCPSRLSHLRFISPPLDLNKES